MDSGPSTQTGERFAAPQQTRRGRRAERARAPQGQEPCRAQLRPRATSGGSSGQRAAPTTRTCATLSSWGDDAGQASRYAPTLRPDPYLTSHGGLFEEKRADIAIEGPAQ